MESITRLRLTGADALGVLHRIGTQSLADLAPGEVRASLFCDFRGRVLHRAVVAHAVDGAIWLLRDDAPGEDLAAFVDRHVFREDLRIENLAPVGVDPANVSAPPGVTLPDGAASELDRIAAGLPRHGHEIRDDFNPYEIGLGHEVHLSKGCYTGQEALQRLITYASVKRSLVRVWGRGTPPATPCDLVAGSDRAGRLTSATAGDRGWTGLAVLKRTLLEHPPDLTVEGDGPIEAIEAFPERAPLGRG